MWRFKTEQEFKNDGLWNTSDNCPLCWNSRGEMNHYMGQPIPKRYHSSCEANSGFDNGNWYFGRTNYIKEGDETNYEIY